MISVDIGGGKGPPVDSFHGLSGDFEFLEFFGVRMPV
jgi:hypothetical protein